MGMLATIVRRSRGDFRLAALLVSAALITVALVPFAVYRAVLGQWLAAAVDLGIALAVLAIAVFGWRRRDTRFAGPMMAGFASLVCATVGFVVGLNAVFWTAP